MTIKCFYKRQFLSKRSLSSVPLKDRRKIHRFRTFYQEHNMVIALPVPHYLQQSIFFTLLNMLHVILIAIVSIRKMELLENHDRLKLKKVSS